MKVCVEAIKSEHSNRRIHCKLGECMHNEEKSCVASNIQVREYDEEPCCNTFQTCDVQQNTAQERMLGVNNGYIGDGVLTEDYYRVEFADLDNPLNMAKVTCTVSHCLYNTDYVCRAANVDIGSQKVKSKYGTYNGCKTYTRK